VVRGQRSHCATGGGATRNEHQSLSPGALVDLDLEGSEVKTVQGKPTVTVKAGDVLHEGPGEVHETRNTAPVKLLIFRIMEKGKEMTIYTP
jgi:hypothetical protein